MQNELRPPQDCASASRQVSAACQAQTRLHSDRPGRAIEQHRGNDPTEKWIAQLGYRASAECMPPWCSSWLRTRHDILPNLPTPENITGGWSRNHTPAPAIVLAMQLSIAPLVVKRQAKERDA